MAARVAVIGAGAVGLSAALCVQQTLPNAKVTLISDKFDKDTTSWGAGGLFRLDLDYHPKEDHGRIRQWATDSWKRYSALAQSGQAEECGMLCVSGTLLYNVPKHEGYSLMAELSHDFQILDAAQLKEMNPHVSFKYGYDFSTLLIHTETYLKWLMRQFLSSGGSVQCWSVATLTQLQDDFDVVVNCCGLRAVDLCQDKSMFPVMGHLIKVQAPWVKKFYWSEEFYMFPHKDYILLGGIREKDNWNEVPDPSVRNTILTRAKTVFPHLKHAPVVGEWVGLRPGRKSVRLEVEQVKCKGKPSSLPVIHNYGHTGDGITLSWGCALEATRLVREIITGVRPRL